ncbi:SDR family NAD(P)-dependent oxidoreductase [Merdimmobilis hominis]|uniref:SDR family NAD(P)-dependent oxidoreductase n=1 Tax=Merdimmobilis hominis TaxID=2897707 RepID=UPI00195BBE38|nr:SDR family NAD(P)-dependent oxidoreductase [Merdimmobilis hominis]
MISIDLSGKTALITGATGQLGRVMAKTLAKAGADIILHYHKNEEKANALAEEIRALGVRCFAVSCDVGELNSVFAMRDQIAASFSMPDIIVDNAVVQYVPWTSVLEQNPADYESQFRSCVMQNVNMAKAFLPFMKERGYGRMIGINTECAMQNFPGQSAYVSGKRGMDGVMRVLAKEVGPFGITVNQVAPGWTISDRDRENHTEVQPQSDALIPLRRRGTDQEVANAVLFLASDLASYITGTYLPVCGGNVMPCI